MAEITKEDLNKLEENLGRMMAKGFNENTEQHQQIFKILNEHSERFEKIDERFEKIDGRFDNVNARLDLIEQDLKEIKEEAAKQFEVEDLQIRMKVVEEKAGIIS